MERTIENGFELTGPIARGDWETVDRHLDALAGGELEPLYRALAEATRPDRRAHIGDLELPRHGAVGLVPTMGALHDGHARSSRPRDPSATSSSQASSSTRRSSPTTPT